MNKGIQNALVFLLTICLGSVALARSDSETTQYTEFKFRSQKLASWEGEKPQPALRVGEQAEDQKYHRDEAEPVAAAKTKATQRGERNPAAKKRRAEANPLKVNTKTSEKNTGNDYAEFRANPCKSSTAKFTSTCQ